MPTTLIIIHPRELLRLGLLSVFKGQAGFKVLGQGSTAKDAYKLHEAARAESHPAL